MPPLAGFLGLSLDELVGETAQAMKRGPTPKLQQQREQNSQLPRAKQRFVIEMLDTVLQQTGLSRLVNPLVRWKPNHQRYNDWHPQDRYDPQHVPERCPRLASGVEPFAKPHQQYTRARYPNYKCDGRCDRSRFVIEALLDRI